MSHAERREFQRLRLRPAIAAVLGGRPASLVEVGILGARVATEASFRPGILTELTFAADEGEIVMRCEIVRAVELPGTFESGVRFRAAVGESGDRLRHMLSRLVAVELELQKSDATLHRPKSIDGDRVVHSRDVRYLCYRLERSGWSRRAALLPEQPETGFTVAREEDPEEISLLCSVYEAADEEGRRLIRMFAELSVAGALGLPPSV